VYTEHGLGVVLEVGLLVVLQHVHLVLLVPRLLLLQLLCLLKSRDTTGIRDWSVDLLWDLKGMR